jgi:hypothetical protein
MNKQSTVACVCGEPTSLGIVHRQNAPCFYYIEKLKPYWVGLTNHDISNAAFQSARSPVHILETTAKGLCIKFNESVEWYCSDKYGDFMVFDNFLVSFARAIEKTIKDRNT